MEIQRVSPPAYISHEPADLHLPSVPQTVLSRPQVQGEITLPDLRTVLSPDFEEASRFSQYRSNGSPGSPTSAGSLPRIDPGYSSGNGAISNRETAVLSPSEAGSVMSIEERSGRRSTSVVSMDDPDVRIAAEALSGLGNPGIREHQRYDRSILTQQADFSRSPRSRPLSHASPNSARASQQEPEPLLQLFTKAHPWVGGTINGSLNAYSTTKNYSPRLVQYGANLVERNITIPVVSTVSTVGRMTGVESGLRWYYGGSATSVNDLERDNSDSANKRRRIGDMDLEYGPLTSTGAIRRDSQESGLEGPPAYRASKPPSYREKASPIDEEMQVAQPNGSQSWSSQVFVMTSGLGVALSQTSRNSLRFSLSLLSNSAERVSTLMDALKMVLEQYDQASDVFHQNQSSAIEKGERQQTPDHDESARRLAALLKKHSDEIWHTLHNVVNSVSNYAGGALPENARQFVRNQLMSLPQRWRFVSDNQTGESETSRSAHRMIAFATEGLDMMSQVSQTMKLTLESAERWLERAGRRRELADSPQLLEKDTDMHDADGRPSYLEKQWGQD